MLFTIIKAENSFSPNEIFVIQNLSRSFGISAYEFESLLMQFQKGKFGRNNYSNSHTNTFYRSDPYKILNLNPNSSAQEIKKQYRNLSKKYHPDLTVNLPKAEREKAEIKMRQINNAYEQIKKEKNFS